MDHLGKDQKVSLSKKTSKLFGKAFGSAVWSSTRPTLPLDARVKCLVMASHDARGWSTNDVCKILGSLDAFIYQYSHLLRATPLHLCRRYMCIAPSAVNVWYQQVFETATMTRGTQAGSCRQRGAPILTPSHDKESISNRIDAIWFPFVAFLLPFL